MSSVVSTEESEERARRRRGSEQDPMQVLNSKLGEHDELYRLVVVPV